MADAQAGLHHCCLQVRVSHVEAHMILKTWLPGHGPDLVFMYTNSEGSGKIVCMDRLF